MLCGALTGALGICMKVQSSSRMMGTNCSSCAIGLAGCCGCCGCCCARRKPGPPKCVWKAPYRMLHAHEARSMRLRVFWSRHGPWHSQALE